MRYEILSAVLLKGLFFWDITLCGTGKKFDVSKGHIAFMPSSVVGIATAYGLKKPMQSHQHHIQH